MTPEQAFQVVVAVCSNHLCNAADRDVINQALAALQPTPPEAPTDDG